MGGGQMGRTGGGVMGGGPQLGRAAGGVMGEVGYEIDSAMAIVELRSVLVDVSREIFALWCAASRARLLERWTG